MNVTRVGRLRRPFAPGLPPGPGVLDRREGASPPAPAPRREGASAAAPLELERLERVVLVAYSFARERAAALLEGLGERERVAARSQLEALAARASPERQARVAQVFGPVPEAPERLRRLMAEASPALQAELLRRLPPYYRSLFVGAGLPRAEGAAPALGGLAERLIREATR